MAKDSGSSIKGKKGYWLMGRLWRITDHCLRAEGRVRKGGWKERRWKLMVKESVKEEAGRQWVEEVERRNDLVQYGSRQTALGRADYIKGFGRGNEIRAEIKSRCEWGDHWVD